jgi:hypothetical protein
MPHQHALECYDFAERIRGDPAQFAENTNDGSKFFRNAASKPIDR